MGAGQGFRAIRLGSARESGKYCHLVQYLLPVLLRPQRAVRLTVDGTVAAIVIDPSFEFPDVDRSINEWRR